MRPLLIFCKFCNKKIRHSPFFIRSKCLLGQGIDSIIKLQRKNYVE